MERVHDLGSTTATPPPGLAEVARLYRWPVADQPWVRSDFVTTIDGAAQGADGRSGTINTEADHLVFDALRALCDAVVVGAGTVRRERYRAIELSAEQQRVRTAHGLAGVPALVVVSRSGRLPDDLADGAGEVVVLTGELTPERIRAQCTDRGWLRLLLEGGPTLHHEFLAAGMVDEICLSLAPTVAGGDRLGLANGPALAPPPDFAVGTVAVLDDTVLLRWRRRAT